MSAFGGKPDMPLQGRNVRFWPNTDLSRFGQVGIAQVPAEENSTQCAEAVSVHRRAQARQFVGFEVFDAEG